MMDEGRSPGEGPTGEGLILPGDRELILPKEGLDLSHLAAQEDMPLRGGVKLSYPTYRSRQDEAMGIINQYRGNTEKTVEELGKKIHGPWDDYHGISYLHFPGEVLDGLDIRGVAADYAVFTAGSLRYAKADRASLYATVFSIADLEGISMVNANARHLVAPFANFARANLMSLKAESGVFNFANFYQARTLGMSLVGAYLIGVTGISPEMAQAASSFEGATVISGNSSEDTAERMEGHALSSRFTTDQLNSGTVEAKVYDGENWTRLLSASSSIEGALLREIALGRADLTHLQAIGSVWDRVIADEARLRAAYASGVVASDSSFDNADTNRAWFPGFVGIGSSFKGFRPGNIAGAAFIDSDLSEMDTDLDPDAATGGALFIGKDKHQPQIPEGNPLEQDMLRTTIEELPPHARRIIGALREQNQLTSGQVKKTPENRSIGGGGSEELERGSETEA